MAASASTTLQQMNDWTRWDPRCSMTGLGKKALDDLIERGIFDDEATRQQVENLGILCG